MQVFLRRRPGRNDVRASWPRCETRELAARRRHRDAVAFGQHEHRTPTYGAEPAREDAMAAFAGVRACDEAFAAVHEFAPQRRAGRPT